MSPQTSGATPMDHRVAHRQWGQRAEDGRLKVGAVLSLLVTDVALRVLGFRRLMRHVPPARHTVGATPMAITPRRLWRARRFAAQLESASLRFSRMRCLHRSVALHFWLRRKGLPSELRIGVRKADGALFAHAWVELGGTPVNDHPGVVRTFAPLAGGAAIDAVPWDRYAR